MRETTVKDVGVSTNLPLDLLQNVGCFLEPYGGSIYPEIALSN